MTRSQERRRTPRRRLLLGSAIPILAVLLVGALVTFFTATGDVSARTTVWIVAAVLWPVPFAVAATVATHRDPNQHLVVQFLSYLLAVVALTPFGLIVGLCLAGPVIALWPGDPRPPDGVVLFLLAWLTIGMAAFLVAALLTDDSDPYAGGWAPW